MGTIDRVAADPRPREAGPHQAGATEVWQVIYLGKSRIGQSRSYTRPVTVEGKSFLKCEYETHLSIKRFGEPLRVDTRRETDESPDGGLRSFIYEMKNPPAAPTRASGRVEGNQLAGEINVGGTANPFSVPWDPEVKSPAYLDRLPVEHPFKPFQTVTCKEFLPEQMQVSEVHLTAGRREAVTLLDGRRRTLLKLTVMESILPQTPSQSYLDERGNVVVSTAEMLGQTLTTYTVPAEEALKEVAGGALDIAVNTLVGSTAIPQAHRTRHAVYRIKMRGEDPTPYFPNYPYQKVIRKGIDECEITVRAVPPVATRRNIRVERQYLAGSRYLQTADSEVLMHVDRAARNIIEPAQVAIAMEKYVNQQIQRKDFSTALASAAEVARSLQGDCTEHAVLLAAMLRARNIPSRIAVGLVYIESLAAFGGHMWTEALLGDQWVPLDATLGQGGTGADRIKLADSSFADNAPSPMTTFLPLLHVLGRIELTVVETSLR
jgi:transglutaminase-like putative cysteine protease